MGWTYPYERFRNRAEFAQFVAARYERDYAILDKALVGNNLWMRMRSRSIDSIPFIALFRLQHGTMPGEWGYKDMDESMFPYYYDCPLRLMKDPAPASEQSVKWRAAVRAWHAERKTAKANQPRYQIGNRIRLNNARVSGQPIESCVLIGKRKRTWIGDSYGIRFTIPSRYMGEVLA